MSVMVVGASGATGNLVVNQLLQRGFNVKALVRSRSRLGELVDLSDSKLNVIEAAILDISAEQLARETEDCVAVVSCLGHRGIYSKPRNLCEEAARRLYTALKSGNSDSPKKLVVMGTTGAYDPALGTKGEKRQLKERIVLSLVRGLIPPAVDNQRTATYLRNEAGQTNSTVQWVLVRPDDLLNEDVSEYVVHPSVVTDCIFNAGKVSRANVAHFMCELIENLDTWHTWQGKMPVVLNKSS